MAKNLLLADDSVTIHKMVELSLTQESVALVAVKSVGDALARARSGQPDAILADTVMPDANGYDLAEAVRADPGLAHIPVVLLVSANEPFNEARATAAGVVGWLPKPFQSSALIEQVKKAFVTPPAPVVVAAPKPPPEPTIPPVREISFAPPPREVSMPPVREISFAPPPREATIPPMREASIPPMREVSMPPIREETFPPPREASIPPLVRPVQTTVISPAIRPPPLPSDISIPPPPRATPPMTAPVAFAPPTAPPMPVVMAHREIPTPPVPTPALPRATRAPIAGRPMMPPRPPGIPVPGPRAAAVATQSQEALLRAALSQASREMIERVIWEVVPELAETMIKEELQRLIRQRTGT